MSSSSRNEQSLRMKYYTIITMHWWNPGLTRGTLFDKLMQLEYTYTINYACKRIPRDSNLMDVGGAVYTHMD